jgi:hypothetical protein
VEEGDDRGSGPGVPTWRRGKTGGVRARAACGRTAAAASPIAAGADGCRQHGTGEEGGWLACGLTRGWGPVAVGGAMVTSGARDGN